MKGPNVECAPVLLEAVTKRFGSVTALEGVDLDLRVGELLAVVGPSGCGKSTMLRLIAGLSAPDEGVVMLAGSEVAGPGTWVPPERRRVGMVFQDHALFPHLDVAGNVGFGLDRRNGDRAARVGEVLDLVRLGSFASRYPHELSGGEQQRVALARALAPAPVVVLLDEPFSNLDRNLRAQVRGDTVEALRSAGASGIFVTHDQDEALMVGDRIAVAKAGRFEQVGTPQEVFHTPASRFVATFMGEADFVPGQWRSPGVLDTELGAVHANGDNAATGPVEVMVRPHDLVLIEDLTAPATVERTEFRGATVLHHVRLAGGEVVRAERAHDATIEVGTPVQVRVGATSHLATFAPVLG